MKILAATHIGMEDSCKKEIKEKTGKESKIIQGGILFETTKTEDLITLSYCSQTITKIIIILEKFKFKDDKLLEKIEKKASGVIQKKIKEYFETGHSFCVSTLKNGYTGKNSSPEIIDSVSTIVRKNFSWNADYKEPETKFIVFLNKEICGIGIDFCMTELSKRHYKIFQVQPALKGGLCYGLLRFTGYNKKGLLLDPNCGGGELIIEAGLFKTGKAINYYDKEKLKFAPIKNISRIELKKIFEENDTKIKESNKPEIFGYSSSFHHLNSAKKNAKIAGVNDCIQFGRNDLSWLDLKFDEKTIDFIITFPMQYNNHTDIKKIEKYYDEFFKQSFLVLKDKGKIGIITQKTEVINNMSTKNGFKKQKEKTIMQGKEELHMIVFGK